MLLTSRARRNGDNFTGYRSTCVCNSLETRSRGWTGAGQQHSERDYMLNKVLHLNLAYPGVVCGSGWSDGD